MIILVGASACGKTVVAKKLINEYGFEKVVTYTTRPIREGEVNDVDYHFISKDKFLELKEKNFFIETTLYNNNYYGTSYEEINKKKVLIVEIDGANIYYEKNINDIFFVFLEAPLHIRKKRMIERNDPYDIINKRLKNDDCFFNKNKMKHIDLLIETNKYSVDEAAKIIYDKYDSYLRSEYEKN